MIAEVVSTKSDPQEIVEIIKSLNMTAEIKKLFDSLNVLEEGADENSHRASILNIVNQQTNTLILHSTEIANVSVRVPGAVEADALYTVPGYSILFAINNEPFTIQSYGVEVERLTVKDKITVVEGCPVMIDGRDTLFDYCTAGADSKAFIGSINLPDRSVDIDVFDRQSLNKIAWFPHDDSAARYLVSLELLEAAQDPQIDKVAKELIYHTHPAVAWRAFQIIYQDDPKVALGYVALLRQLKNRRLDCLLDQCSDVE